MRRCELLLKAAYSEHMCRTVTNSLARFHIFAAFSRQFRKLSVLREPPTCSLFPSLSFVKAREKVQRSGRRGGHRRRATGGKRRRVVAYYARARGIDAVLICEGQFGGYPSERKNQPRGKEERRRGKINGDYRGTKPPTWPRPSAS